MDIEDAKILKAELGMHILSELREFEDTTGMCVETMHIHRSQDMGCEFGEAYEIKVDCKI